MILLSWVSSVTPGSSVAMLYVPYGRGSSRAVFPPGLGG
jgi:hypothetical protein